MKQDTPEITGSLKTKVSFRFYAELNDHLAPDERFRTIEKEFFVPASVKDMIESFGVPHTEVELVLINGESSDFSRLVRDADRVAVYPVFESLDITPELRIRRQALRESKFVLDVHLGRLAAYLRMLGFDAAWQGGADDAELARTAKSASGNLAMGSERTLRVPRLSFNCVA